MKKRPFRTRILVLLFLISIGFIGIQAYTFIKNPYILANQENESSEVESSEVESSETESSESESSESESSESEFESILATESELEPEPLITESTETAVSEPEPSESEPSGMSAILAQMQTTQLTEQLITVVAEDTDAQVTLWEMTDSGWAETFSVAGYVGTQGIGPADEYHSYTPEGAYTLGFAFGKSDPGTSLEFREITPTSYWISNVDDPDYNTWQERDNSSSIDEHLTDSVDGAYKYSIVINYNKDCIPGGGSAFFLHCNIWEPTAGCVTIPEEYMLQLLHKLKPGAYIVMVKSEADLLSY